MEQNQKLPKQHLSLNYHFINPIIASAITFFFLWVLQDFLLLSFVFSNVQMTTLGFIILSISMIVISWYLPPYNPNP